MELLFAHGDDGSPILDRAADPSLAATAASPRAEGRPAAAQFLADITANAGDLVRQRWAVVVPAGAQGARLEALVQGLVRARAEDQQADVLAIRVPPGMDAAAATAWKKDVYPALYDDDEARRPRYLMILGDLDLVSLETQQVLAQDGLPGRLACANDDGYAAYADKVLAWRRRPSDHDRARAVFYTVHDGTPATAAGHAKLIEPCHDRCARTARDTPRAFPATVEARGAAMPDPGELRALVAARQPSVLLSMSHGLGPPRRRPWSPAEARDLQGAMSFGGEGALTGADVASAPFLPGGVWIYVACFGAGTPRASAYHHWLARLARDGATELAPVDAALRGFEAGGGFISGLAKAALGNPDGPLAVLGHVDLAWSYSYEELRVAGDRRVTGSNRALNFSQLMAKLVAGERAGAATLLLRRAIDAVGAELVARYDREERRRGAGDAAPADALALGHLWMLHQDLHGYTLLGDPAVRLPLAAREPRAATRPEPARTAVPHLGDGDAGAGTGADASADVIDRLERAALAIAGGDSPGVLAAQLGVPRSELALAAEVYRAAGRAALSALVGAHPAPPSRASDEPDAPDEPDASHEPGDPDAPDHPDAPDAPREKGRPR